MSEEIKDTNVDKTEVEETEVNNVGTKDDKTSEKLELTQAELDEIIAKRLARERNKYADYDELKSKLSEYEKAEEERKKAEMTELERLQAELEAKEKAERELAEKLERERKQRIQERINREFVTKATANNIAYVDAAIKLADLSKVDVDEDGNVNGLDDVIVELVENNPFLVKAENKPKHIGGGTSQKDKSDKTKEQLLAEAEEKARKTGRLEDRVKVAQLKRELGL